MARSSRRAVSHRKDSSMTTERFLIACTKLGTTKAGRAIAELYSTDTRLAFPVLILFDLSMLASVGLDPDALPEDGVHKRFWAYYEESEKRTSKGNPYRDVVSLEPESQPTPADNTDTGAIVNELRQIRMLLERITAQLDGDWNRSTVSRRRPSLSPSGDAEPAPSPSPQDTDQPPVTTQPTASAVVTQTTGAAGEPVTSLPANHPGLYPADQPSIPVPIPGETEAQAIMREFYDLAGSSIQDGSVTTDDVNELVQIANDTGWPGALDGLKHALVIVETYGL